MSQLQTKLPNDTWVAATWEEYIQEIENPAQEKAKGYYYNGQIAKIGIGSILQARSHCAVVIKARSHLLAMLQLSLQTA